MIILDIGNKRHSSDLPMAWLNTTDSNLRNRIASFRRQQSSLGPGRVRFEDEQDEEEATENTSTEELMLQEVQQREELAAAAAAAATTTRLEIESDLKGDEEEEPPLVLTEEERASLWYSKKELHTSRKATEKYLRNRQQQFLKSQGKQLLSQGKVLQKDGSTAWLEESNEFTVRGLEDVVSVRFGMERKARKAACRHAVLLEQDRQLEEHCLNHELIRKRSLRTSKEAAQIAQKVAEQDARAAQGGDGEGGDIVEILLSTAPPFERGNGGEEQGTVAPPPPPQVGSLLSSPNRGARRTCAEDSSQLHHPPEAPMMMILQRRRSFGNATTSNQESSKSDPNSPAAAREENPPTEREATAEGDSSNSLESSMEKRKHRPKPRRSRFRSAPQPLLLRPTALDGTKSPRAPQQQLPGTETAEEVSSPLAKKDPPNYDDDDNNNSTPGGLLRHTPSIRRNSPPSGGLTDHTAEFQRLASRGGRQRGISPPNRSMPPPSTNSNGSSSLSSPASASKSKKSLDSPSKKKQIRVPASAIKMDASGSGIDLASLQAGNSNGTRIAVKARRARSVPLPTDLPKIFAASGSKYSKKKKEEERGVELQHSSISNLDTIPDEDKEDESERQVADEDLISGDSNSSSGSGTPPISLAMEQAMNDKYSNSPHPQRNKQKIGVKKLNLMVKHDPQQDEDGLFPSLYLSQAPKTPPSASKRVSKHRTRHRSLASKEDLLRSREESLPLTPLHD